VIYTIYGGAKITISSLEQRMEMLALLSKLHQKSICCGVLPVGSSKVVRLSFRPTKALGKSGWNKEAHSFASRCANCGMQKMSQPQINWTLKLPPQRNVSPNLLPEMFSFTFIEMFILSVSRLFRISWDMIRSILKDYLEKSYHLEKFQAFLVILPF
jgi:hypothetical protein